jgi:peptidyl-prolyl cis-trans isomerase B (cyclophilin B)
VWLGAGLPVDDELETSWLRDPYWIIPVAYLEAMSGRGDSTRALETARAMLETRDDRDLRQGLAGFLGIELPEGAHEPRLPVDVDTLTAVRAVIDTDQGEVVVELMTDIAPVTCATFAWLAGSGFYDGIWFHRVIPGFVAQAGCPQGNGFGGPGFSIPNERSPERFTRGVVGMADAGLDTGGSQFFIMLDDHDRLDCRYTAFGRVIGGEETIDRITVGTLIREVRIEHVEP